MFFATMSSVKAQDETKTQDETISLLQTFLSLPAQDETKTQDETIALYTEIKKFKHEVSVYGGGGISALNYKLDKGGSKTDGTNSISGVAGVSYTLSLNDHFGISTGVEVTRYGAKTTYHNFAPAGKDYGMGNSKFNFRYTIANYAEEQSITLLSIPVMLQYTMPISNSIEFYGTGGLKIGLPRRAEATIFPDIVNTYGDYYFENQIYQGGATEKYGFVKNATPEPIEKDIDLKTSFAISIEGGARFCLTENLFLYTGAYIDYGLNNIRTTQDLQLINHKASVQTQTASLEYASVLNTPFVNNVKIFGAGLKVRLSFGWAERKRIEN
jgi:hypothetical protein